MQLEKFKLVIEHSRGYTRPAQRSLNPGLDLILFLLLHLPYCFTYLSIRNFSTSIVTTLLPEQPHNLYCSGERQRRGPDPTTIDETWSNDALPIIKLHCCNVNVAYEYICWLGKIVFEPIIHCR